MIRIFIESGVNSAQKKTGKKTTNEQNFVENFIMHHFPQAKIGEDFEVIGIEGKDNLANSVLPFKENTINGGKNLLIFDADTIENGGGFISRKTELLRKKVELDIEFELFLWPNNQDDGDFESLLMQMINKKHRCLLNCFEKFENCIRSNDPENRKYDTPGRKAAVYTYISMMKKTQSQEAELKKGIWMFDQKDYWDLDAEYAKPMKDLVKSLIETNLMNTTQ